jgi:HD-GYP domain-containing protein (c-di-GMP phosphodiesterase class II)
MRRVALGARLAGIAPQPALGNALAGCGVLSLAAAWLHPTARHIPLAAGVLAVLLAGAVVAAYYYPIHVRHQTKVLLVSVAYYLLAVLVSPPLAALAAGLGALGGEVSRRRASGAYPSDIASEVGRRLLMVLIGSLIAHAGGGGPPSSAGLLGAALALGLLDALSLPLVLGPISGEPPRQVLVATVRETALPEGIQYIVGILGADAAVRHVWTLGLLVVPCALVYVACKVMAEMHDGTRQLLESMADAVDLRDPYTGGHSRRVTEYSAAILCALGLQGPEVELIVTAARVHDIGKIGTPDAILHKPGKLDPEERAIMEQHPVTGAQLLARYRDFARGVALVRHHHESWDGTGYPDGLKGTEIPFGARVIAVADSFDAMTSDRPYRAGMPVAKAAAILRAGRNQQWDGAIVDALLRTIPLEAGSASSGTLAPSQAESDMRPDGGALARTA